MITYFDILSNLQLVLDLADDPPAVGGLPVGPRHIPPTLVHVVYLSVHGQVLVVEVAEGGLLCSADGRVIAGARIGDISHLAPITDWLVSG